MKAYLGHGNTLTGDIISMSTGYRTEKPLEIDKKDIQDLLIFLENEPETLKWLLMQLEARFR